MSGKRILIVFATFVDTLSIHVKCHIKFFNFILPVATQMYGVLLILQEKISVAEDYFGSGGIFSITVYSGLSLFVVLIAAGIGWEMYRKSKKKKQGTGEGKVKLNANLPRKETALKASILDLVFYFLAVPLTN